MTYPGSLCSIGVVPKLTEKVMELAIENNVRSIALCGLGCGIGGLMYEDVAKSMSSVVSSYAGKIKYML
jgi:O-acetyl-ADP-ribose deacetylase (regulator of RNase III)